MSQRTHGIEFHRLKGVKRQSGRFQTNGINNPSVIVGSGFTVARTGVGVFRVTFDGPYKTNLCTLASVGPGAAPGPTDASVQRLVLYGPSNVTRNTPTPVRATVKPLPTMTDGLLTPLV